MSSSSLPSLPPSFLADEALVAFCRTIGPCTLQLATPEAGAGESQPGSDPYRALIRAVAGQQLHEKAARQIYGRLCALQEEPRPDANANADSVPHLPPPPERLLALGEEPLRRCGLSRAKTTAVLGLAQARLEGVVPDLQEARALSDQELLERLTPLRGIGRWTVEMLLIFNLGRPDVMPVDDLGVQEGWRRIHREEKRLTPARLRQATLAFAPHRTTLAWYCWRAKERLAP
ncbi:DNA-3-methyladenine glycosylase family protein [Oecophyllibacter saccharovorans]|uniref:DNA-3-methyladenine glycosylase family protein n=1 Tax=Oecophyllibacter saccharovorans TaxID=2558360 RepID=UPI001E40EE86|nr:DNA-3-methyladenine glycosylase 2 family protein [Oecophyllibacter saccharovorans]